MSKPLPCPLCGDTELDGGPFPMRRGDNPEYAVRCGSPVCGCEVIGPSREEAVRRWNRRTPEQQTSPHEPTPEHGLPSDSRSVLVLTSYDQWMVASYLRPGNGVHGWRYDNEDENTRDRIIHWEELPKWPR